MTVQQLIQKLGSLPPEAQVRFKNMEIDSDEPISTVKLEDRGEHCVPSFRYRVILK